MFFYYFMCVQLCNVYYFSNALQCMDQNNEGVDWFVIYKLPKQTKHLNKLVREGVAYTYMTSKNYTDWTLSGYAVDNNKSMVANTLNELYTKKENLLYILYNDQPPYGDKLKSKGHTKGVVMANEKEGFWLIHSVPNFPHSLEKYVYPATGVRYGQSFLCISMDLKGLNTTGIQLQYNEPHIYAQNTPDNLKVLLPELSKAADNKTITKFPWYSVEHILSTNGKTFVSFAKSGKFNKDLYSDLVSSELGSDLYVETWPNEPNKLPSECDKKFRVNNVLSVSILEANVSFKTTVDHSKWAVSSPKDTEKWICIGDINRAERQTLRGGGTTCLSNEKLAGDYQKIISSVQECKNDTEITITML